MHNRIAWWLLAAGLLISMTAHAQTDTPPSEPLLMVPLAKCNAELTTLENSCDTKLADFESSSLLRLTQLENACAQTLRETAATMQTACDAAVEAAVAAERRDSEPRIAGLEAQNDRLRQQAQTWQTVSIVTGAVAVVLLVALVVF